MPERPGFIGIWGSLMLTLSLPCVLGALHVLSNNEGCLRLLPLTLPGWRRIGDLFSWQGVAAVYAYFAAYLALHAVVPAQRKPGVLEPNDSRWTYRLNGLRIFVPLYSLCVLDLFTWRLIPLSWVADHFLELLSGAAILAISLAICLYAASFRAGAVLAPHGATGYPTLDFWMGRELNPRLLGIDLKEFCELYPGLSGWALLNLAFASKQLNATGQVSLPMLLLNAFQLFYVLDALYMEPSILTTMDITTDGFGFMLVFGDLAWVPFVYCLQAKYIAEHAPQLAPLQALAIVALNVAGYVLFRGANGQKDRFRTDPFHPSVRHLKTLQTKRGTQLLCSGFWGVARHINYTGDLLMGLAWCLTCGHQCVVPYFYIAYFTVLLVHRERRDDAACAQKYGSDWDEYKRRVPWRLIPMVY